MLVITSRKFVFSCIFEMKSAIVDYLLFLQSEQNLSVTLHLHTPFMCDELLPFNVHCGKYCLFLKGNEKLWAYCTHRQKKIYDKCKENTPFFGMCFAGVYEYIYPVSYKNEVFGFVSVSGYRISDSKTNAAVEALCARYHLDRETVKAAHRDSLTDALPAKKRLDMLLFPLCAMLREYCRELPEDNAPASLYGQVLRYLRLHHTEDISLSKIAKALFASPSTISHMFKQKSGKSIREYIAELRLADARHLLLASNMSVQSIALAVGYRDSAHFCKLFQKTHGMSPRAFRHTKDTAKGQK